jgi:hypothetical protein
MSRPAVDGLERELAGAVSVLRLDIRDDRNRPFVEAHRVEVVPTFLLFARGERTALRVVGRVPSAAEVREALAGPRQP